MVSPSRTLVHPILSIVTVYLSFLSDPTYCANVSVISQSHLLCLCIYHSLWSHSMYLCIYHSLMPMYLSFPDPSYCVCVSVIPLFFCLPNQVQPWSQAMTWYLLPVRTLSHGKRFQTVFENSSNHLAGRQVARQCWVNDGKGYTLTKSAKLCIPLVPYLNLIFMPGSQWWTWGRGGLMGIFIYSSCHHSFIE